MLIAYLRVCVSLICAGASHLLNCRCNVARGCQYVRGGFALAGHVVSAVLLVSFYVSGVIYLTLYGSVTVSINALHVGVAHAHCPCASL